MGATTAKNIAVHTFNVDNLKELERKMRRLIPQVREIVHLSHAHNNVTRDYYDHIDREKVLVTNGSITVVLLYIPLSKRPLRS